MEKKINISLFLMGVISALLALLLSFYVYSFDRSKEVYQRLAVQADIVEKARGYIEDYSELIHFCDDSIRITVFNRFGVMEYDSAPAESYGSDVSGQRVFKYEDVKAALRKGIGGIGTYTYGGSINSLAEYHYTRIMQDRSILRLSSKSTGSMAEIASVVPALFIIFAALFGLSVLIAIIVTKLLVRPINLITENLWHPDILFHSDKVYKELLPLISELQMQRHKNDRSKYELAQEKDKLSVILQDMTEGILLFDRGRKILTANASAQKYLQFGLVYGFSRPLDDPKCAELKKCVETSLRGKSADTLLHLNGRYLRCFTDPVSSQGRQSGVLCFILDVTEQVEIEAMKQDITTNVSHEMKTPLTSIMGYAEMIESGLASKPEDIQRFSGIIHREAERLLKMIQDILKLSEIEETHDKRNFETVDLLQVCEECTDVLRLTAEKKNVTLHVDGERSEIMGERSRLFEMVYNLADNAIRYNNEGGDVWLRVEKRQLQVSDNGIGIPDDAKGRIFERFYRVDKSRSKKSGGTGLGLAIVKHIAQQHDAQIQVSDRPGGGTVFAVVFGK